MTIKRSKFTGNYIATQKFGHITVIGVHRDRVTAMRKMIAELLRMQAWIRYLAEETV